MYKYLIGPIISLILAILFAEPLLKLKKNIIKRLKYWWFKSKIDLPKPETLSLGSIQTTFLVIDGDGELYYSPDTIICRVVGKPLELPSEVMQLKSNIETKNLEMKNRGETFAYNGPLFALGGYAISRTIPSENLELSLSLYKTDYYTFLATVGSLDCKLATPPAVWTIRSAYLSDIDYSRPVPFLATGFGIALVVITRDNKIIVTKRGEQTAIRPGEYDISVAEAMHPVFDRLDNSPNPSIYRTGIRGAMEEIGVTLFEKDIIYLGFGVDAQYYQWEVIGMAKTNDTSDAIMERRSKGTGGKWEVKHIEFINADPKAVLIYIKNHRLWSIAKAALYWTLVYEFGKNKVERILINL